MPPKYPSGTLTTNAHGQEMTKNTRSEEHTSELQSRQYLVCRLLLEKKNHPPLGGRLPVSLMVSRRSLPARYRRSALPPPAVAATRYDRLRIAQRGGRARADVLLHAR